MKCGAWCVFYRDRGKTSACKGCSGYESHGPSPGLGPVDSFRLARLLVEKKEKERRDRIPRLSKCSCCRSLSLFYNSRDDAFECLNLKCTAHGSPIVAGTEGYESIVEGVFG